MQQTEKFMRKWELNGQQNFSNIKRVIEYWISAGKCRSYIRTKEIFKLHNLSWNNFGESQNIIEGVTRQRLRKEIGIVKPKLNFMSQKSIIEAIYNPRRYSKIQRDFSKKLKI